MYLNKLKLQLANVNQDQINEIENHLKSDVQMLLQIGEDFQAKINFNVISDKIKTIMMAVTNDKDLDLAALFRDTDLLTSVKREERSIVPVVGHIPAADNTLRVTNWPFPDQLPGSPFVVGGTGSGKTLFIRDLKPDVTIRMSEPVEDIDYSEEFNTISVASFDDMLTASIVLGLLGLRVAVDSIRAIMYAIKGPATSGGIVATAYNLLTSINNVYAHYNIVCPIVINPMTKKEDVEDVYIRAAASSVGAVHMEDGKVASMQYRSAKGRRFDVDYSVSTPTDVEAWQPETVATIDMSDMDVEGREPRRMAIGIDKPNDIDDADDLDPRVAAKINL